MSRSHRHTPVTGNTKAESDALASRADRRALRRANRVRVAIGLEPLVVREMSDPWWWPKDGRKWIDVERCPEVMRK